jgi:hypothetical protein
MKPVATTTPPPKQRAAVKGKLPGRSALMRRLSSGSSTPANEVRQMGSHTAAGGTPKVHVVNKRGRLCQSSGSIKADELLLWSRRTER